MLPSRFSKRQLCNWVMATLSAVTMAGGARANQANEPPGATVQADRTIFPVDLRSGVAFRVPLEIRLDAAPTKGTLIQVKQVEGPDKNAYSTDVLALPDGTLTGHLEVSEITTVVFAQLVVDPTRYLTAGVYRVTFDVVGGGGSKIVQGIVEFERPAAMLKIEPTGPLQVNVQREWPWSPATDATIVVDVVETSGRVSAQLIELERSVFFLKSEKGASPATVPGFVRPAPIAVLPAGGTNEMTVGLGSFSGAGAYETTLRLKSLSAPLGATATVTVSVTDWWPFPTLAILAGVLVAAFSRYVAAAARPGILLLIRLLRVEAGIAKWRKSITDPKLVERLDLLSERAVRAREEVILDPASAAAEVDALAKDLQTLDDDARKAAQVIVHAASAAAPILPLPAALADMDLAGLRRRLRLIAFGQLVVSVVVAVAVGLLALYFGKPFGTPIDYVQAFLWGFGTDFAVKGFAAIHQRVNVPVAAA